ncbi:AraC family transcriptional regulator [Acetivibrio cellulolyticus]|uniref:AraC family transcriptional regulator n=1 Tax=Acetivibrio cellulolyticus TaxID=35830 RepID=UPI0001E2D4A0|nr:AraC family transcriptional regulator [Acetivibrio cellulolyticus]
MDWISRLQKVIEYIELHLTEDQSVLKLNMLAKQAYSSEYEFQKVFSIVTGITVGEYIRNRKLSLSGEELLLTDTSILDIGLKYGYETAESFTKAFTRFHGATPSAVRKRNAGLKLYNKLSIRLQVDGGYSLEYQIINHSCVRVIAKTKVFKPQSIEDKHESIPEHIEKWASEGMYDILYKMTDATTYFADSILGIHDGIGCKPDGSEFRMSVGVESIKDTVPDGYEIVEIPARKWLVFKCKGLRPMAIQKLWNQIYTNFLPYSTYQIKELGILEVCREGFRNADDVISELWLPLLNNTIE